MSEPSFFEKALAKWSKATREDLILEFRKLQKSVLEQKTSQISKIDPILAYHIRHDSINLDNFSNEQLEYLIAQIESDLGINSQRE